MHILLTGNTTFKLANFRQGLIRRLLAEGHRVTILAPPDDHVLEVQRMGCAVLPLQMDRNGTAPMAEARLLLSLLRQIQQQAPDVVFSYTIKNNIYAGLSCRLLSIPFIPNVTGLGPAFNDTGFLNWVVRGLYRLAFRRAQRVFFQNSEDLAVFAGAGLVSPDRVALLPGSGADLSRFRPAQLPDAPDGVVFLLVARMLWDKGIGLFAEAAEQIHNRFPAARFRLLGPMDPDSKSGIPEAQIREWVAMGHVEYLGATRDVLPHLRAADCIVLPSYYKEGTPRALLEAGAVGRPIITTDMPGCRDLVPTGKNGFLIPPRDANALAEAFLAFLNLSPEERQAMGDASRSLVAAHYDENIVIDAYINLLQEITT